MMSFTYPFITLFLWQYFFTYPGSSQGFATVIFANLGDTPHLVKILFHIFHACQWFCDNRLWWVSQNALELYLLWNFIFPDLAPSLHSVTIGQMILLTTGGAVSIIEVMIFIWKGYPRWKYIICRSIISPVPSASVPKACALPGISKAACVRAPMRSGRFPALPALSAGSRKTWADYHNLTSQNMKGLS